MIGKRTVALVSLVVVAVSLVVAATLLSSGEEDRRQSVTLKYKITVEVQTPEGIKSGSVVRQYTALSRYEPDHKKHILERKSEGEAVVVDLAERGKLLGVVSYEIQDAGVFTKAFTKTDRFESGKRIHKLKQLKVGDTAQGEISLGLMAGFYNIQDPSTLQFLEEWQPDTGEDSDTKGWDTLMNFTERLFGQGVSVKSVTYQITDEPVTKGEIYKVLPWLQTYQDNRWGMDGDDIYTTSPKNRRLNAISTRTFVTEPTPQQGE